MNCLTGGAAGCRALASRRFIEVSRAAYERHREQVAAILHGATQPLSTTEVAVELIARNGFTRVAGSAIQTARAHLEQLRGLGQVTRIYADGAWHWTSG